MHYQWNRVSRYFARLVSCSAISHSLFITQQSFDRVRHYKYVFVVFCLTYSHDCHFGLHMLFWQFSKFSLWPLNSEPGVIRLLLVVRPKDRSFYISLYSKTLLCVLQNYRTLCQADFGRAQMNVHFSQFLFQVSGELKVSIGNQSLRCKGVKLFLSYLSVLAFANTSLLVYICSKRLTTCVFVIDELTWASPSTVSIFTPVLQSEPLL